MFNLRYLAVLSSLAATVLAGGTGSAKDSRLCMSNQIGMDYVEASVNKMFDQYIKRWNNHEFPNAITQQINHAGNVDFGGQHFLIDRDQEAVAVNYDPAKGGKDKINFNLPVSARSFKKIQGVMYEVAFKDTLTVSVEILKHNEKTDIPQWNLNLLHKINIFTCQIQDKQACDALQRQLKETFHHKVMDFVHGNFFDQPSALRQMLGIMQNTNDYVLNTASTTHFAVNRDNLYVLLNCQEKEIIQVQQKKVPRNIFELGLSQNLFDAVNLEKGFQINMDRAVKFALNKFGVEPDTQKTIAQFGLTSIKNQVGVVQDQVVLDKIDFSKLQKPELKREYPKIDRWDDFKMAKLQHYSLKQNVYLQIYDKKAKSDISILPFEVSAEFDWAIISDYQLKFGPIQQINFRDLRVDINMGDCQTFENPLEFDPNEVENFDEDEDVWQGVKPDAEDEDDFDDEEEEQEDDEDDENKPKKAKKAKKAAKQEEDEEDFDEEEEEEDGQEARKAVPEKKKNNMAQLAQLVCGFRPKIQKILQQDVRANIDEAQRQFRVASRGARNEWMAVESDLGYQFQHLCSGLQINQPLMRLDENRFIYSAQLKDKALNIDAFCDQDSQELFDQDPRVIMQNNRTYIMQILKANQFALNKKSLQFEWTIPGILAHWIGDKDEVVVNEKLYSPIFKGLSMYQPLKAWCKTNLPEYDSQMCANTFQFFKNHQSYDVYLGEEIEVYGDLSDAEEAQKPGHQLRLASRVILYFGLLLYILEINLNGTLMRTLVFFGTIALTLPVLDMPFYRYCPDYTAYVTQASQFYFGQTDYVYISASQGNIFYPALHLWHYILNYKLHLATPLAEYYLKMVHVLMHAIIQYCVSSLAYMYFFKHKASAQMVCFMMLSNDNVRRMYQFLYNDCLMTFYLVLCIYFFFRKWLSISAFFFSISLGIKTGVYGIVPALFGIIQWQYGTISLIGYIIVVAIVQIIPPLPLCGPTFISQMMGWPHGSKTSLRQYSSQSTLVPGLADDTHDNRKHRAAGYYFSVFWKFLTFAQYEEWIKTTVAMKVILSINIYYFFVRRFMIVGCLERLGDSIQLITNSKVTLPERTKCIEIMLILYVSACQLMPGGHENFQVWFIDLIPIVMFMSNLHPVFFFKIYMDIYPGSLASTDVLHHIFSLSMCGLLLVFKGGIEKCQMPQWSWDKAKTD